MKEGPDISHLAALIGEPARANILTALMAGQALTAGELAREAGITIQTASAHLKKLTDAKLLMLQKQGRHRYFSIMDDDVGHVPETLMGLAEKRGFMRIRPGPSDPALRLARRCYGHLAGEMGVMMYDYLVDEGFLDVGQNDITLTDSGTNFIHQFGIDLAALSTQRRPLCRACLDWSMRRNHLAGTLGNAMLDQIEALGWAKRNKASRIIKFGEKGDRMFRQMFAAN